MSPPRRDRRLIDALDAIVPVSFGGTVWRVVREGRDPCQCSTPGGRWDDGTFDVLYTARARDGAIAEIHFHLLRGQPVFPSRARFHLYQLEFKAERVLDLSDPETIAELGVDMSRYGQLSYEQRVAEYPRTQDIGEIAHMLDYAALLAPNARWDCANAVLFCDAIAPGDLKVTADHGLIDWRAWRSANADKGKP